MKIDFIRDKIYRDCNDYNIVVLKGFSPSLIEGLGKEFPLLDDYIIEKGKIILENINENRLMLSILSSSSSKQSICTIESFVKLCTQITGLRVLQKKICVLENIFRKQIFKTKGAFRHHRLQSPTSHKGWRHLFT